MAYQENDNYKHPSVSFGGIHGNRCLLSMYSYLSTALFHMADEKVAQGWSSEKRSVSNETVTDSNDAT